METLTKNKQSKDAVRKMTEKYMFPLKMTDCEELTEGMFNAAYEARLSDGSSVILKIAPPKEADILTYEKNIMYAEVQTMKMLSQQGIIPVPHIYGYDDSCTVCNLPYFVMEKLRGESMNKIRYSLSSEQIDSIYLEAGRIIRNVNSIVCPCFGYPAQSEFQGNNWYSVFCKMMNAAVFDAKRTDAVLEVFPYELMTELGRSEAVFEEVTEPRLVHYDCWDGNIFVESGNITGIIDWERALWADPLMELGFRRFSPDPVFQKGYGLEELNEKQVVRALWYDVYMMVLAAAECKSRKYDINEVYGWGGVLKKQFKELKGLL